MRPLREGAYVMTMRQLKETLAGDVQIIVTRVNGIGVVPEEYWYDGVSLDVHHVTKIKIVSVDRVEVEITGGTSNCKYNTQGFRRDQRNERE